MPHGAMPRLLCVCRVERLLPDIGAVGVTGIDERPIAGPVAVRTLGLYTDLQADCANHGGEANRKFKGPLNFLSATSI